MTFDLVMLMRRRDRSSHLQAISDLNKEDPEYLFGVVRGGSTARFFEQTSAYSMMSSTMEGRGDVSYPPSVEEGVRRVRASTDSQPYIFIGEQHTLEYHASHEPCDLVVVKGRETVKEGEYRLAVKNGYSPETVTKLQVHSGAATGGGGGKLPPYGWTSKNYVTSQTANLLKSYCTITYKFPMQCTSVNVSASGELRTLDPL